MTLVKKKKKKSEKRLLGFITLRAIHNKSTDSCGITSALHHCIQNSLSIRGSAAGFLCCLRSRSHHKSQVSGGWEGGSFAFRVYHDLAGVGFFWKAVDICIHLRSTENSGSSMGRSRSVTNLFGGRTYSREFWSRIRKRRNKVRGLGIRGFALTHPWLSITQSHLQHCKI